MSFDLTRLRRYPSECFPGEEMEPQEIKDLKDGVPNYPMPEFQGPEPSLEHMCCECTGSGVMIGHYPCRPCGGTGYIVPEPNNQFERFSSDFHKALYKFNNGEPFDYTLAWNKVFNNFKQYPNERELALLNARIAKLKAQLSTELQKKKSERNQFEINQIQQSIIRLKAWKLPNKNSTQTGF